MAPTTPPRLRPDLHLTFTPLMGSPNPSYLAPPGLTPSTTPRVYPIGTNYSPFRSAGLKPPTPYGGSVQFSPRPRQSEHACLNMAWMRPKRLCSSRYLFLVLIIIGTLWWWRAGINDELEVVRLGASEFDFGGQLFEMAATKNLQFFPAVNPKIHYIGRWTPTPNRLRIDGTFPGVYFDLNVVNTTTVFLSLRNAPKNQDLAPLSPSSTKPNPKPATNVNLAHLSFRYSPLLDIPAPPVSLLARVDQEEYVLLPNSSLLVSIRDNDLDPHFEHHIRIIVPMTDDHGNGIIQLEGVWLSKDGRLARIEGSLLDEDLADEDSLFAESAKVGEKHRDGLKEILNSGHSKDGEDSKEEESESAPPSLEYRKKILEIITNAPGSPSGKNRGKRRGGADGLLAGVMGWEYLLGEMFGADHITIGVDGMCLIQDCIGAVGTPSGLGDVFFRRCDWLKFYFPISISTNTAPWCSAPPQSAYFEHPWMFHTYIPDVLVINVGSSDAASFATHETEYSKSAWDLSEAFEDTYVSLVRSLRQLAYPKHPAVVHSERATSSGIIPPGTPAAIPIFIMRPLRGELEHATQGVVNRLRADGDKAVFWLDTSGWLADVEEETGNEDFYIDETVTPPIWRLTEQGNQRVAIFLHMHVCRYLASAENECAFLPTNVYQGKVFDPEAADFDRYLENDKEKKLKELFWEIGNEDFISVPP
ncbi:hypothetical protein MMC18_000234 [Xylographa bjoerkii]|nr:hypothetical protein [Xylographa bjoerkii]